jgi:serine/threonine protein kinase
MQAAGLFQDVAPEDGFARGQRRFGDYILQRQIGSGGMGVVYEATQVSLNRKVALKFIRDSQIASATLLRRFTIEAEAAARLHHPNIVRIHEIGETDGQPYFSMDLVEGESLKGKITKKELVPLKQEGSKTQGRSKQRAIARLIATTARAVHHAHQRGVLHRDLKPANILIDKTGAPLLTDFGLAKILRGASDSTYAQSLTAPGEIAGTPGYMAPEQVCGAPTTASSDVYGLGAILYELLTGCPPFQGPTPLEILRQVEQDRPRRPRALNSLIDKDLETICLKCLEKAPHYRYSSAEALADDLENWVEQKPIKARPAGPIRRSTQWVKRNRVGAALIFTLLAGLCAALVSIQIVHEKNRKIQIREAEIFASITEGLARSWNDAKTDYVTVESRHLWVLAGKSFVYDPTGVHVTFGMSIFSNPVGAAQRAAKWLPDLETEMSRIFGQRIFLNLKLFKKSNLRDRDLLAKGEADFFGTDPVSYLHARALTNGVVAVAKEKEGIQAVLIAHNASGIKRIEDLRGKSIMFLEAADALTLYGKARLADAGIRRTDFKLTSNYTPPLISTGQVSAVPPNPRISRRVTVLAVLNGEVDVGICTARRFALECYRGLDSVVTFTCAPNIVAARAGLDPNLIRAFRLSLLGEPPDSQEESLGFGNMGEADDRFSGVEEITDADLREIEVVLEKAERFDL